MSFFLPLRFFYLFAALIVGFVVAFFLPWLLGPMQVLLGAAILLTLLDALLLYAPGQGGGQPVFGRRVLAASCAGDLQRDRRPQRISDVGMGHAIFGPGALSGLV